MKFLRYIILFLLFCSVLPADRKPMLGEQINWANPKTKGLVGTWLLNEGVGNLANNITPKSGYDLGTVSGAVWVADGISLSADTDYIDLSSKTTDEYGILDTDAFTVLMRCKFNSLTANDTFFSKSVFINPIRIRLNGADDIGFATRTAGGTDDDVTTTNFLSAGIWWDICCTRDAAGVKKVYGNANLQLTSADDAGVLVEADATESYRIGRPSDNAFAAMDGVVAFCYLWKRALSDDEVRSLYDDPYQVVKGKSASNYYVPAAPAGGGFINIIGGGILNRNGIVRMP